MKKLVFSIALLFSAAANAEVPALCNENRVGTTECMATKLCECKYSRGGAMTSNPEGYHWDCGIMRPSCAAPAQEPKPYNGPNSVTIDNSTVRQDNSK